MSGDTNVHGRITITPPIEWPELRHYPWAYGDPDQRGWPDAIIHTEKAETVTDDGVTVASTGVAIQAPEWEQSGRTLTQDVQRIVDTFGTTPDGTRRVFSGYLQADWGHGEEVWRVVVRNGIATEVRPEWPVDAR